MRRALAIALLASCQPSPARAPADPAPIAPATGQLDEAPEPAAIAPTRGRLQIGLGHELVCARLDRKVHCWVLGHPMTPVSKIPPLPGIDGAIDLAVGTVHGCAVTADGRVHCWGSNDYGQLGAGLADTEHPTPAPVIGIDSATAISSSNATTCALVRGGAVMCWGDNRFGQTGSDVTHTADANDLVVPVRVPKISGATAVAAAGNVSCALDKSGVWCWGRSQLASEKSARKDQSPEPSLLTELTDVRTLSGHDGILCVTRRTGEIVCWGDAAGELVESRPEGRHEPISFAVRDALSVTAADSHACAVARGGALSCFGVDFDGVLGRGVLEQELVAKPVERVRGLPAVRSVALSSRTSCAVTSDDQLWCWGLLPLGPRGEKDLHATPVRMPVW